MLFVTACISSIILCGRLHEKGICKEKKKKKKSGLGLTGSDLLFFSVYLTWQEFVLGGEVPRRSIEDCWRGLLASWQLSASRENWEVYWERRISKLANWDQCRELFFAVECQPKICDDSLSFICVFGDSWALSHGMVRWHLSHRCAAFRLGINS